MWQLLTYIINHFTLFQDLCSTDKRKIMVVHTAPKRKVKKDWGWPIAVPCYRSRRRTSVKKERRLLDIPISLHSVHVQFKSQPAKSRLFISSHYDLFSPPKKPTRNDHNYITSSYCILDCRIVTILQ